MANPEKTPQENNGVPQRKDLERVQPSLSIERAQLRADKVADAEIVLDVDMLTKTYGTAVAANEVSFQVRAGSFTGVVGPNGAGKTTTLTMITGLNRPSSGRVTVMGEEVWQKKSQAKKSIGVLPDRLRLFDRLTGAQLLHYTGVLHGLKRETIAQRARELAQAFALDAALGRLVSDYSAGMQKKIMLACAMIHAPKLLVLDEPFEAIDPVSAANVTDILEKFVAGGGSVVMSSHSLELIERVCDHVVVIVDGAIVAKGTVANVRGQSSLADKFAHLVNDTDDGALEWLHGL